MRYKWNIFSRAYNWQEVLLNILKWKNIPKEKVREFIDFKIEPHDPLLLTNMDMAVKRVKQAIENNEKICIIGDYDADGVTATSVMYIGLRSIFSNVLWMVPDRFKDGYGMNNRMIDLSKREGCRLIITVDNGIAAKKQVEYANSLGIDVVVTDHHQVIGDLPTAITVNPQIDNAYPFKSICGCMVAFKTIMALIPDMEQKNPELYQELVSIAAIGTITDVMELMDENRFYVKQGLKYLSTTKNIGLRVLLQKTKLYEKDLTASDIGFIIGPCINAAGRLESPDIAVNLILCDDEIEADKLATRLLKLNEQRKAIQKEVLENIEVNDSDKFIVIHTNEIGHGILGIIAGNIAEKYQRPCFVLGGTEDQERISGSGRSVYGYDINSCVQSNKDIAAGGGHSAACGVSLKFKDLDEFKNRCNDHFSQWLSGATIDDLTPTLEAACEIDLRLINDRLINNINKLKPYGPGNEEPVFVTRGLEVVKSKVVGKNANVIQFELSDGESTIKAVGFSSLKEKYEELNEPSVIDVLYTLDLNEWPQGTFNPQLILKDIRSQQENEILSWLE